MRADKVNFVLSRNYVTLSSLNIVNFKNYQQAELDFSEDINCFTGDNGSGKTNILDAIYYLSFCKSYFNPVDYQNIRHGEDFFVIEGTFEVEETETVFCGVKKGQKKTFKRNKKAYERLADHIGNFPCVMVSPYDTELVKEGSSLRRKFIDSIISQYDRVYLDNLINYNKALSQRNNLLKYFFENRTFSEEELSIWDVQLVELGDYLYDKRNEFIEKFSPLFSQYYKIISDDNEEVTVSYQSQLHRGKFADLLTSCRPDDRRRTFSTVGLHKDDLIMKIGDYPIKKFGSQGQQKSLLIAMRLAQFQFIKDVKGYDPILLLDDIFDKLDDSRVKNLLKLVNEGHFGQIFITDTSEERMQRVFEQIGARFNIFNVTKGKVLNEAVV